MPEIAVLVAVLAVASFPLLVHRRRRTRGLGVDATTRVRVGNSAGHGILHRSVELDASLVVLGWPEPGETGTSPDIMPAVSNSPAPLVVARLQGYRWQRVRLCAPSQVKSTSRDRASALRVLAVAPDHDAIGRAIGDAEPLGDLVLSLCHGPKARDQRPLLASHERLYDTATPSLANR